MISIYLCEDNPQQLANWIRIIENFLLITDLNESLTFSSASPKSLLAHLKSSPPEIGLYFLDIGLRDDINGLQLAAEIRQIDPRGYIVFITSHSEMSYMTFQYKVEAMDFILKDQADELPLRICECLETANKNYYLLKSYQHHKLSIKISGQTIFLDTDSILLLESTPDTSHKILIHTENGIRSVYGTLKEFEAALSNNLNFVRCSRSMLVNMNYVARIDHTKKEGIFTNGEHFSISSRYFKNVVLYENAHANPHY